MCENISSVDNLDFVMESDALGHMVMDLKQSHESLLGVAGTITLEEIHVDGVGEIDFKISPKEITAAIEEGLKESIEPEAEFEVLKEQITSAELDDLKLQLKPSFVSTGGERAAETPETKGAVVLGVRTLSEGGRVSDFTREQKNFFVWSSGLPYEIMECVLLSSCFIWYSRCTIYGAHPTPYSLQNLTLQTVKDAVMNQFVAANTEVSIVGDFFKEDIESCVMDYFGTLRPTSGAERALKHHDHTHDPGVSSVSIIVDLAGSWQNDIFVVAEPGELAEKFLQNVKYSFQSMLRGRRRRYMSGISNISIVADLVASKPCFQIGAVVHWFMGRQTQVNDDDQEIGAYMFRKTIPSMHLAPADVRWMLENVKFEIELEEVEEEDYGTTTTSPNSDWENMTQRSTPGKDQGTLIWDNDGKEGLLKFMC
ncbi:stromal processing peptidase chloroplastic [Tanacetum coccineum]